MELDCLTNDIDVSGDEVKNKQNLQDPVFSFWSKLRRAMWNCVYICLFRYSPIPMRRYRLFILKCFGATVCKTANVYPSAKIWHPKNLMLGGNSTLGPAVIVYNQGLITIGERVIVSQGAHLCASTHDYNNPLHPLILAPISIENDVWVCADAFVGPNVTLSQGSVIGARAVMTKSAEEWSVFGGNPAKKIKNRERFTSQ